MYWDEEYEDYIEEENESYNMMDSIFNDIKEKFYERLKSDVKQKIKELEEENKYLNEKASKLEHELYKYEKEKSDIRLELSRAKLSDLFKECGMINVLYSPSWEFSYKRKCDKCDDDRRVHYKTPRGKDAYELCECGEHKKMYYPAEYELVRFYRNNWSIDKEERPVFLWFEEVNYEKGEFKNECIVKHIYNNESYEELFERFGEYSGGLFFKSKEECQDYCDWLSKKFGWTPDMIYNSKGNEMKSN